MTTSELIYYVVIFMSATSDVMNRMLKQGHALSLEGLEEGNNSDVEDDASAVVLDLVTRCDELSIQMNIYYFRYSINYPTISFNHSHYHQI